MKKSAIGLALLVSGLSLASAQAIPTPPQGGQQGPQVAPAQVAAPVAKSLEGKLGFAGDLPTLQAKDKTYNLMIRRFYYYAYTEGWKAGDTFKVDGYELAALPGQDKPSFLVTKLVVNGKTFDFSASLGGHFGQGYGPMMGGQGYGPMMGGQGYGPMMGNRGRGGRW